MKILILYSEIAGYVLSCVEALAKLPPAEIKLIRWPVNQEAPFQFGAGGDQIDMSIRTDWTDESLQALVKEWRPEVVFTTGWMDKGYVQAAKTAKALGIPVIAGIDNHWTGSPKQHIATWISPWMIHSAFDYLWVPGYRQYAYAKRLGFKSSQIRIGYYSGDTTAFGQAAEAYRSDKAIQYPRELLYVGRIIEHKGIGELWNAFIETSDQHDWRLRIVGAGDFHEGLADHPRISVQGFVQPEELPSLAEQAGAFILPSRFEPWGVVLHEFAAAGLPLIASDECGSADAFIRPGYNGYTFEGGNQSDLADKLLKLFSHSDDQLRTLGERSEALAAQITPEMWASTLYDLAKSHASVSQATITETA
ncbi:glycosyltransferase family 4 protein [Pontibacter sp. G13]|uniref:glycosyltransferase family 4 protein n=1 Tax=Pontibacter sp. G13 TaxID=3074898 RepID=UPI00288C1C3C|nr:glycosyltransferase family 4 protein [Pontibacter sp. G13]WNJ19270.1 glycosyltransferase family 4 protein [Pontibacter sp. G13]